MVAPAIPKSITYHGNKDAYGWYKLFDSNRMTCHDNKSEKLKNIYGDINTDERE